MEENRKKNISHYELNEEIGRGGMGIVYKARDLKLDRYVAIKFLPQQLASSEEYKSRFIREAKSAASLSHPNILSIYEIDEADGSLFIAMEYVNGETLKSHISKMTSGSNSLNSLKRFSLSRSACSAFFWSVMS